MAINTENTITTKITSYKNTYNGKFWNAGLEENALSESNWGVTTVKCKGGSLSNGCHSNKFGNAWQCYGFSLFIAYILTGNKLTYGAVEDAKDGATLYNWTVHKSNLTSLNLAPGDIVRTSGHSAVIWSVNGDTVQVVEVWGSAKKGCEINFGYFNGYKSESTQEDILKQCKYVLKYN